MNLLSITFLIFIALRFIIIIINVISKSWLLKTNDKFNIKVSVLIPARNEETNIIRLLESVTLQNYTNYEVIVLDDASTDRTYEISASYCQKNPKLKVIKGKPLPPGWLGKNFACHQLAMAASGEYLLFLDADVAIKRNLINSAIKQIKNCDLHLLSLFPEQQTITFGEKIIVPLMNYLLLSLLPIRLIYSAKNPAFGVASGQFMMFDAKVYRERQWHNLVKDDVVEDLAIMRRVKAAGLNGQALMANSLINCRMYSTYTEALNGFSKNFLAVFNNSILLFAGYLLLLFCGAFFLFATFNLWVIGLVLGMIITGRIMISLLAGQQTIAEVLLHPLQMTSLAAIFFNIAYKRWKGSTQWKGRVIKI